MTNEVTKPEQDGFAGYEDRIEGDDRQQIGRVITRQYREIHQHG